MPYSPVGIQQLSKAQVNKLLMGGRVRVKAGNALKVQMVKEHAKKLASASKKGAGIMLQLDPYACDMNREELEGCGIGKFVKSNKESFRPLATSLKQSGRDSIASATMAALDAGVDPALVSAYSQLAQEAIPSGYGVGSKIKSGTKKLGQFIKGNKEAFRPLATSLKQSGRDAIADASMYALDSGVDPALVSAYSQMAQEAIPSGYVSSGYGIGKKITKFVQSPAVKTVRKAFRPLAQQAFNDAQEVAFAGLDMATQQALGSMSAPTGMGMGRKMFDASRTLQGYGIGKKLTKFAQSPAVKTIRKAFRPLAQQAFEDAQEVAFAGLDMATQQALGSMSAPTGMGIRGAVARARRNAGGALFPAGLY